MKLTAFLLFSFISSIVAAQRNPVSWTFSVEHVKGDEYDLVAQAQIANDWKIYSQFIEEGGPIPTSFTFTMGTHYQLIGKAKEVSDDMHKGMDPIFEMEMITFAKAAAFRQRIKVIRPEEITGFVTFMCCDSERCLAPTDVEFTLEIPAK